MIYLFLAQLFGLLIDLGACARHSERHKDLQILVLRQQLRILQRQHTKPPRIWLFEKIALAVLAAKLVQLVGGTHTGSVAKIKAVC